MQGAPYMYFIFHSVIFVMISSLLTNFLLFIVTINQIYFLGSESFQHKLNKMAAQHLPPEYECGFCASKTESMRDPRELPCQHVFCLSCIEGYYNQHGSVTCPTCG